jgi:hypothetical protein
MLWFMLVSRRSLTPAEVPKAGSLPQRRASGPRKEVSDRVKLHVGEIDVEGWALNISTGGLRAIIDTENIDLDELFGLGREILVYVGEQEGRAARIVWVQGEPDGAVIGVAFLDQMGERPPSVPPGTPPRMVRSPMASIPPDDSGDEPKND